MQWPRAKAAKRLRGNLHVLLPHACTLENEVCLLSTLADVILEKTSKKKTSVKSPSPDQPGFTQADLGLPPSQNPTRCPVLCI